MGRIVASGDVFTVETPRGKALVQLLGIPIKNTFPMIRVLPGLFTSIPTNIEEVVRQKGLNFIQYPVYHEERRRYIKFIGNYDIPSDLVWPRFMRTFNRNSTTGIVHWTISDLQITNRRYRVFKLSDEEKRLSPYTVPGKDHFIELLSNGWNLENWGTPDDPFIRGNYCIPCPQDLEAVMVHIDMTSLPKWIYEKYDIATLEKKLIGRLAASEIGMYQGSEEINGKMVLTMYGPNAEQLFINIEPILTGYALCESALVEIRRGPPGSPQGQVRIKVRQPYPKPLPEIIEPISSDLLTVQQQYNSKSYSLSSKQEQAVIVKIYEKGIPPEVDERNDISTVEDRLIDIINRNRLGEYDGNEFGSEGILLFMYGPDAEKIYSAIEPILIDYPLSRNAIVELRYTPSGSRKRVIDLAKLRNGE